MSLIDDLVNCKECNQWFEDLTHSQCCNNKFCKNCEKTHSCGNYKNNWSGELNNSGGGSGGSSGIESSGGGSSDDCINSTNSVDKSIENLYSSFLSVNSSYSIGLSTSSEFDDNDEENEEFEQDQLFEHIVFPNDTLQGLSIRYNCLIQEIKSINKIRSIDSCSTISKTILLIPKKQNQTRQQPQDIFNNKEVLEILKNNLINRFIKKSKCTDQSKIETFLEKHGYDFFKALLDFNNQLEIEKQQEKEKQEKEKEIQQKISTIETTPEKLQISQPIQTPQNPKQIFKYQEFGFGSSPDGKPNFNLSKKFENLDYFESNNNNDNNNDKNNNNNLLNNSDFLIKSYREKYSDIPQKTKVHNINKPTIRKVSRTCCGWF
ncbi:hypothetical protein ACTFIW_002141 [Dictyostelium discoideum]